LSEEELEQLQDDAASSLNSEAVKLSRLDRHSNLLQVVGFSHSRQQGPSLITEFVEGTNLGGLMKENRQAVQENVFSIVLGITSGMVAVHKAGLLHLDLKPANILFRRSDLRTPIIADFGVSLFGHPSGSHGSRVMANTVDSKKELGTCGYTAPEIFRECESTTSAADVFSFAIVVFELLANTPAWSPSCFLAASYSISIQKEEKRPAVLSRWDSKLKDLLARCWARDPQKRPSFLEISRILVSPEVNWNQILRNAALPPASAALPPA
jgi:serine/threonine protein kinase